MATRKMTIAELEKLLNSEDDRPVVILPNGKVRLAKGRQKPAVVMTSKQNLGGEY